MGLFSSSKSKREAEFDGEDSTKEELREQLDYRNKALRKIYADLCNAFGDSVIPGYTLHDITERAHRVHRFAQDVTLKISRAEAEIERLQNVNSRLQAELEDVDRQKFIVQQNHLKAQGNLQAQFNSEREATTRKHNRELSDLRAEIRSTKDLHVAEMESKAMAHQREMGVQKAEHEALKQVMVQREIFDTMTDSDIAVAFQYLALEIDDLARVRWNKAKESSWPWPDRALQKSDNVRKLKKSLVQSKIWAAIYIGIFSSPFKVFGGEGRNLDEAWTEQFGHDDFNWPRPTQSSEKWRYQLICQYQDALSEKTAEGKHRQMRNDYSNSIAAVAQEISQSLASVSSDALEESRIKNLATKAADLWLSFMAQRCRIHILVTDSHRQSIDGSSAWDGKEGSYELVVKPEIRRIGDKDGQTFTKVNVVKDCAREIFSVVLPTR